MAEATSTTPPVVEVRPEKVETLNPSGGNEKSTGVMRLEKLFEAAESGGGMKEVLSSQERKADPAPVKEEPKPEVKPEPVAEELSKKVESVEPPKEELDPRSALEKHIDSKSEPKKQETKADKVDPKDAEEPTPDELTVLPHDKPKTAKRIQAILKRAEEANRIVATTKVELDAKAKRLSELEDELKKVKSVDPLQDERVKAQIEELSQYRRRYAIEKDPEFKSKFDGRIESAESSVMDTLKNNGAPEWLTNAIKAEGGWVKFANSGRPITLNTADGKQTITAAQFAEQIINDLPFSDKKAIEAATIEQIQLNREKSRYVEENTKVASEYFRKQEEEAAKRNEAQQKAVQENQQLIESWIKEQSEKNPHLKLREVPANATPEERAAIEDDNRYTTQLNSLQRKFLAASSAKDALEVVHDAVAYWAERRNSSRLQSRLSGLEAENRDLKAQLDKVRSASRTTNKPGSLSGGGTGTSEPAAKRGPRSIEDAFAALERGERLGTEGGSEE